MFDESVINTSTMLYFMMVICCILTALYIRERGKNK